MSVDYVRLTISAMFKDTCAFLKQQISKLEEIAHGRSHNLNDENDWYFEVYQDVIAAPQNSPSRYHNGQALLVSLLVACLLKDG